MCGRFALIVDAAVLADVFDVEPPLILKHRFNIAPTQTVPVVRKGSLEQRELAATRWGLIPSWAEDAKMGARMINARAETVAEKPSFRSAVKCRRCLIPASGFYEWVKIDGAKKPHFVRFKDGRPFAFAGLWERWAKGDAGPIDTCTIITTTPNELMAKLHHRMPVILPPVLFEEWLEPMPLAQDRLAEILVPHSADGMQAYPVSTYVNKPANGGPECIERVG